MLFQMRHWTSGSRTALQYFCLQVQMGRRELLVTKVKKAFLEFLEKMDTQDFLASQETEVTGSFFVIHHHPYISSLHLICAHVCRFRRPEGSLWIAWTEGTKGSPWSCRYSTTFRENLSLYCTPAKSQRFLFLMRHFCICVFLCASVIGLSLDGS